MQKSMLSYMTSYLSLCCASLILSKRHAISLSIRYDSYLFYDIIIIYDITISLIFYPFLRYFLIAEWRGLGPPKARCSTSSGLTITNVLGTGVYSV